MALSKISTGTEVDNTVKRPTSVTTVSGTAQPSADSNWTTTAPKVLYTAPSDCSFVKIYWRKSYVQGDGFATEFPANTTSGYYFAISLNDGVTTRELFRGNNNSASNGTIYLNRMQSAGTVHMPTFYENDVLITFGGSHKFVFDGNAFVLKPGEKLQLETFADANDRTAKYSFEAWVY